MSSLPISVIGGLTLDDIVLPNGSVHRGVMGGNAYYAALGARLWVERINVISFAGEDMPPELLDGLSGQGIDTSLVDRFDGPSIRLWILYEADGRRQIHYQHGSSSLNELLRVPAAQGVDIPADARSGLLHVAALPVALQVPILERLSPLFGRVTLDTIEARGSVGGDLNRYAEKRLFDAVTAFLPSVEEMDVIRDGAPERDVVFGMDWQGLETVVVKDGARGCRLYDVRHGTMTHIPAWPARIVDPTGAGDAFCGGFLAGLARRLEIVDAAILGTVSASFVVEAVGGKGLRDVDPGQVEERRVAIRHEVIYDAA